MILGITNENKILYRYETLEDIERIYDKQMRYANGSHRYDIENKISNRRLSWNPLAENVIRGTVEDITQIIIDSVDEDRTDYCILDIGCGGGGLAIALASSGFNVYGCDPAPSINFAYLKRDVAMQVDSVEQYTDLLSKNIYEAISGNTIFDEAKGILKLPLKKVPLFFQLSFEEIKQNIDRELYIPDMVTMAYTLKFIQKENMTDFISDVASVLDTDGKILIVDDKITVDKTMLPSGLTISQQGEFRSNNDIIDKYSILEKKI
ncbi:MAG: methyltransferase domain-containing protein [Nanohaloarchaea archaeon]|nr:methyltransferase domain-containing protein [Candidatus Nanohaloarchaea archaeon]